jgi:hypothetical protein
MVASGAARPDSAPGASVCDAIFLYLRAIAYSFQHLYNPQYDLPTKSLWRIDLSGAGWKDFSHCSGYAIDRIVRRGPPPRGEMPRSST